MDRRIFRQWKHADEFWNMTTKHRFISAGEKEAALATANYHGDCQGSRRKQNNVTFGISEKRRLDQVDRPITPAKKKK